MRLSPILLSLALLCACGHATATESRQMGPDGSNSCPDSATASNDAEDTDGDATPARRAQKAKPATTTRANGGGGGSGQRSSTPRWHSFLPGMIR